ncbi:uncharacterized protein LOC143225946 [Tachypleus tridentatus]|uniref:uncharacterized protein LOC143225946 n=1 Tax=Tachypleus tridentatus TaxID=6853 RepID=UPI003FD31552
MGAPLYEVSFLFILITFSRGLTPSTTNDPQPDKEDGNYYKQEQFQINNKNADFTSDVNLNKFEYRRIFGPREIPKHNEISFTTSFNHFPELPTFTSLPEELKENINPSLTRAPTRTSTRPTRYKFNPPLVMYTQLISVRGEPRYQNRGIIYQKHKPKVVGNGPEYGTEDPTEPRNSNQERRANNPNLREKLGVGEDVQRKGPQSPYIPPEETIYSIPLRKTTTSPPEQSDPLILKIRRPHSHQQNNVSQRRKLSFSLEDEEYLPKYTIFRGNTKAEEYPKVFRFNEKRINIVEFDRDKKSGRIENLEKGDILDPDNIPRKKFLIFHGGVYDQDDTVPTRRNFGVIEEAFKIVQDYFKDEHQVQNDGYVFYEPL